MMKSKYLFWGLLALTACAEDHEVTEPNQGNQEITVEEGQVLMTVSDFILQKGGQSRTAIEILDSKVQYKWTNGDEIGIFPFEKGVDGQSDTPKGDQVHFGIKTINEDATKATFDGGGWSMNKDFNYIAYCPFQATYNMDVTAIPVTYEGQAQKGATDYGHLGKHDYLVATSTLQEAPQKLNFQFGHAGTLILLDVELPEAGEVNSVKVEFPEGGNQFMLTGSLNIQTKEIKPLTQARSYTLNTTGINAEAKKPVRLAFMTAPMALKEGFKTWTATLTYTAGGKQKTSTTVVDLTADWNAGDAKLMTLKFPMVDVANHHIVNIEAGKLSKEVITQAMGEGYSLKVSGPLNGDDIAVLKEVATAKQPAGGFPVLKDLDLSDANIVAGGTALQTEANKLEEGMFSGCTELLKLILPKSLTVIEASAFTGTPLTSLTINGKPTLADGVFTGFENAANCTLQLTDPELRKSLSIDAEGNVTFKGKSFLSVQTEEGKEYFKIDASNRTITVGQPGLITRNHIVTAIGSQTALKVVGPINGTDLKALREATGCAFKNDRGNEIDPPTPIVLSLDLSRTQIKAGGDIYRVESWGTNVQHVLTEDNALGYEMFAFTSLTELVLPEGLKKISNSSLIYSKSLPTLNIPSTVETIEQFSFRGSNLTSFTIPNTVKVIGQGALGSNANLTEVIFADNSQITEIPNRMFENCYELKGITLPNSVETIGENAFNSCKKLSSITIPDKVTTIKATAFAHTNIRELVIPEAVKKTEIGMVQGCQNLTKIVINGEKGTREFANETFQYIPDNLCELVLHPSWRNDIVIDQSGKLMFKSNEFYGSHFYFKSIKDPQGNDLRPDVNTKPGIEDWKPGQGGELEAE